MRKFCGNFHRWAEAGQALGGLHLEKALGASGRESQGTVATFVETRSCTGVLLVRCGTASLEIVIEPFRMRKKPGRSTVTWSLHRRSFAVGTCLVQRLRAPFSGESEEPQALRVLVEGPRLLTAGSLFLFSFPSLSSSGSALGR